MSKENIKKRFRNWRTWVAVFSLVGFLFTKFGMPEAKSFIEELLPYVFTVGVSLGIWTDHKEKGEDAE
ncbi:MULTISPECIES: hypothetical protein [Bacillus cereus group]|uniref:hypothetical protein n=1 Tax=Bacillus cereus group TaxID=86661 RepID=UPI0022DF820C|nr:MULTISPECIES: hypothetical protein [Bacillus cereus group]HDR7716936.1 hypothetical protein [Bacillus albus]MDA2026708.1 hypothetical protein [Bacillus cereus group sp. Bcc03]MDA2261321.1 hypothetical protein [Bacillus cereus group sp. Bc200]MDA2322012.1 hypothetical protein [Bacillus cereus group sp. Bc177]MDA2713407.1 hypothetical protein [Bacillus cereus group sp. Bc025]